MPVFKDRGVHIIGFRFVQKSLKNKFIVERIPKRYECFYDFTDKREFE